MKRLKHSAYRRAYLGFLSKWQRFMKPTKTAILKEVQKGNDPQHAVNVVFAKYDVKGKLEKLVMDSVMESVRIAGIKFK